jgi:hypothetical protein
MGIFDVFTGDPAKEAAAKNAALLQANKTEGTNTLSRAQGNSAGLARQGRRLLCAAVREVRRGDILGSGFARGERA